MDATSGIPNALPSAQTYAQLTPEQRAAIEHGFGPAVALGVAGSGKTTVAVYRVAHLVESGRFDPSRILLAALNGATALDLRKRLSRHPGCGSVQVVTLHTLGRGAVKLAYQRGDLRELAPNWEREVFSASETVLHRTLAEAQRRGVEYLTELGLLEPDDFLRWVSVCKGNLRYADQGKLTGVLAYSELVSQAKPPSHAPWYLDLLRLYESLRERMGLVTPDDLLRTGWEMLYQHGDILHDLRDRFDCVIVDEYQDINLAQSEILDLVAHPHLNYMALGDDDQAIYESQGASFAYLTRFAQRYSAKRFPLGQNFRSKAGPVMLSDSVIRNNRRRIPKSLRLTRGLGGRMSVLGLRSAREMAAAMVDDVNKRHAAGTPYRNMVVLVRTYAQTPPVEHAFVEAGIPYSILGQQPFYKRPEVQTLIDYCRVAYMDSQLAANAYLNAAQIDQFRRSWNQIYSRPKREISNELARTVVETALVQQAPVYHTLFSAAASQETDIQEQMRELASTLQWLAGAFRSGDLYERSAFDVLRELDDRLDYSRYLQRRYGASETGDEQAETVHQLLAFAMARGNLPTFLANVQQLDEQRADARAQAGDEAVNIRTMYSAKGLEWPVVLVPSCNPGIMPRYLHGNLEEERRLLYVALTRARQHLYVYYLQPEPSQFLVEADFNQVLLDLASIRTAASKYPVAWTESDVEAMAVTAVQRGLWTYFRDWAPWPDQVRRQAGRRVIGYYRDLDKEGRFEPLNLPSESVQFWYHLARAPQTPPGDDDGMAGWLRKLGR